MGTDAKNKWVIAIKEGRSYKVIEPPKGRYYADPFIIDGYVFFEDYDYEKGRIAVYEIATGKITLVLELDHHLSFPNVFKHEGEYYMVPEEGAINQIRLFKAKNFPFGWEVVKVLKEGIHPGDTDIFYKDGWHMFTTNANDHRLWYMTAEDLFTEWTFQFERDIENSRPAGRAFEEGGKLYRPVQDCREGYGKNVILKEFTLSPYEEVSQKTLRHWKKGLNGFHTFNFDDDFIVVDGRYEA